MTFSILVGMLRRLTAVPVAIALLISGCGGDTGSAQQPASGEAVDLVATTPPVADLARNVGGKRVEVTGLLTPNADPHDHEIRPSDVAALSEAELVVRSGGELDAWLAEAIEGSGTEAPVLDLIEHVRTIEGADHEEHPGEDPHAGEVSGEDAHAQEEGGEEAAHT